MISHERLLEILNYNFETGIFTWKIATSNRVKIGSVAGYSNGKSGYRQNEIDGKKYYSHRLAWFYMYGTWPSNEIDHINGIRDDNRISNLREASINEQRWNRNISKNNKSGFKNVYFDKKTNKYRAEIEANGKKFYLGVFDNPEAAHETSKNFREKIHGKFTNHG